MGEQGVVLEHGVYRAVIGRHVVHRFALDVDDAAAWLFKAGNQAQGGCLSAAAGTQQGEKLSRLDAEVDLLYGGNFFGVVLRLLFSGVVEHFANLNEFNRGIAHFPSFFAACPSRRIHSDNIIRTRDIQTIIAARVMINGRRLGKRNWEYR